MDHLRGEGAVASVPPPTEDPSPPLAIEVASSSTPLSPPPPPSPSDSPLRAAAAAAAGAPTEQEDPTPALPAPAAGGAAPAEAAAAAAAIPAAPAPASLEPTDADFIDITAAIAAIAAEFRSNDCGRLIAAVSAEEDIESRPIEAAESKLGIAPEPPPPPPAPSSAPATAAAPVPANSAGSPWWARPSPCGILSFTPGDPSALSSISVKADLIAAAPSPFAMLSTM